jgi:hypothetical protein
MKKVSIAETKQRRNISEQKLTIGLDLGDRNSCYCVVDEAGQIQLEHLARIGHDHFMPQLAHVPDTERGSMRVPGTDRRADKRFAWPLLIRDKNRMR